MGIEMECSFAVPRDSWSSPEFNNTKNSMNTNDDLFLPQRNEGCLVYPDTTPELVISIRPHE